MTRTASEKQQDLASTIKRQAGAQATRRLLRSMPTFKVVTEMPRHLQDLLDELNEVERKAET
ncbi:hypothetical protein ASD64_10745 [Mesorhizobium sp. Root157]|uniref:hypothetical protein n=1 Tax=Mesorhizobium sp. Root157 TaxID=1736477 RepID=UPI0006F469F6|nr:hypothetical protein [Mesorhizobium sp. Root157]KQZ80785.1 hypothetical protein ASD64_10745 [Mesorhizobium sp. Root157]